MQRLQSQFWLQLVMSGFIRDPENTVQQVFSKLLWDSKLPHSRQVSDRVGCECAGQCEEEPSARARE